MNKKYIYVLFFALIGLIACEDNYEAPFPVNDVSWYTSMPNTTEYMLLQNSMMGFIDASQGALTHEWEISEGCYFLTSDVKQGESLEDFIDYEKGLVSNDIGINVFFPEAGRKSVRLKNTYTEKVTYDGVRPLEAVENNGVWVIDTVFTIDVYGPIQPAFKICRVIEKEDGTLTAGEVLLNIAAEDTVNIEDADSWKTVDVEVGERLMFIDLTKDKNEEFLQPNRRTWTIKNNTEASIYKDSITVVYFNVYGFKAKGLGNLVSERDLVGAPKGQGRKLIPLSVNVVQSSQPFTYADGAMWTGLQSIAFNVTGEISSLGDNPQDAFSVHIVNDEKGLDKDISVVNVSFNSSNATRIELDLSEPIYADDVITVNFNDAEASIISVDERNLTSFSNINVDIPVGGEDLLADWKNWSGFEGKAGVNAGGALRYWVGNQGSNIEWMRDESKYFSGEASMKYHGDIEAKFPLSGMGFADKSIIPAGAYYISHKIFIEKGSDIKVLRTDIANQGNNWASTPEILWNLENVKRGEWVTISQIVNIPIDVDSQSAGGVSRYSYYVRAALNPGVTGIQTFYLDDMEISRVEAGIRP